MKSFLSCLCFKPHDPEEREPTAAELHRSRVMARKNFDFQAAGNARKSFASSASRRAPSDTWDPVDESRPMRPRLVSFAESHTEIPRPLKEGDLPLRRVLTDTAAIPKGALKARRGSA